MQHSLHDFHDASLRVITVLCVCEGIISFRNIHARDVLQFFITCDVLRIDIGSKLKGLNIEILKGINISLLRIWTIQ